MEVCNDRKLRRHDWCGKLGDGGKFVDDKDFVLVCELILTLPAACNIYSVELGQGKLYTYSEVLKYGVDPHITLIRKPFKTFRI